MKGHQASGTREKTPRQLTIVIKLGTSSICHEKTHEPLIANLAHIVETVHKLRNDGHRVVLVSSGAIGIGLRKLNIKVRPQQLSKLQAIAAIGQCELLGIWDKLFSLLRQPIAQILLTRNDIVDRTQYVNAKNTFSELLHMGVVPIVNENDTLAVQEIKFGDNDKLSAITAAMVKADYLFLMTDVDCLYDKNPRLHPDAKPIMVVDDISALQVDVSTAGSAVGTGGMATKLIAAKLATSAGVTTVITRSSLPDNIFHIVRYCQSIKTASKTQTPRSHTPRPHSPGSTPTSSEDTVDANLSAAAKKLEAESEEIQRVPSPLISNLSSMSLGPDTPSTEPILTPAVSFADNVSTNPLPNVPLHTRFTPRTKGVKNRRFWILHGQKPHGTLYIDQGAYKRLNSSNGASLLPVGVVAVSGEFLQLETVNLTVVERGEKDEETGKQAYTIIEENVGRALVNYSSGDVDQIKGLKGSLISGILEHADTESIAHRDNIAFFHEYEKEEKRQEIMDA